jgi:TolB-like protein
VLGARCSVLGAPCLVLGAQCYVLGAGCPVGGSTGSRISLAVLPFDNLTGDPAREYLAGGLTEESSASLAQIDQNRLSVKGHILHYKGTTKSVGEIGQELAVDYLVEGALGEKPGGCA